MFTKKKSLSVPCIHTWIYNYYTGVFVMMPVVIFQS